MAEWIVANLNWKHNELQTKKYRNMNVNWMCACKHLQNVFKSDQKNVRSSYSMIENNDEPACKFFACCNTNKLTWLNWLYI